MIGPIVVRPAIASDIAQLPAIERSAAALFASDPALAFLCDGAVIDEAEHARFLAEGMQWVAEVDTTMVGFACAQRVGANLHLREMSVRAEAQGQGVGKLLLARIMQAARDRHFPAVTLTTFKQVPWNAPFYARAGFAIVPDEQLTAELAAILDEEVAHGMPAGSRCAMILRLK